MADDDRERNAVNEASVEVSALLGQSTMDIGQILKLGRGAIIELDTRLGDKVGLYANRKLIARGEVIVIDEKLGLSITEMIKGRRAG